VTRELEYLEEALQEAEAVARWYAERSVTAAAAFAGEIDAAEAAIVRLPEAWPSFDHGTRRYLLLTVSVQRRVSHRSSPHLDRCRGACASSTRILEIATVVCRRELLVVKNLGDKRVTIGSGSKWSQLVGGLTEPK